MVDYRPAGIEGLVVKGADTTYAAGRREWVKVKSRETREVVVIGVTGSVDRPTAVVAALRQDDPHGHQGAAGLVVVGYSSVLTPAQARDLATVLVPAPAGTSTGVPQAMSGGWGTVSRTPVTAVLPLVVEVTADTALSGGRFRHPLRYVRNRPDLVPADVEALETGAA